MLKRGPLSLQSWSPGLCGRRGPSIQQVQSSLHLSSHLTGPSPAYQAASAAQPCPPPPQGHRDGAGWMQPGASIGLGCRKPSGIWAELGSWCDRRWLFIPVRCPASLSSPLNWVEIIFPELKEDIVTSSPWETHGVRQAGETATLSLLVAQGNAWDI